MHLMRGHWEMFLRLNLEVQDSTTLMTAEGPGEGTYYERPQRPGAAAADHAYPENLRLKSSVWSSASRQRQHTAYMHMHVSIGLLTAGGWAGGWDP